MSALGKAPSTVFSFLGTVAVSILATYAASPLGVLAWALGFVAVFSVATLDVLSTFHRFAKRPAMPIQDAAPTPLEDLLWLCSLPDYALLDAVMNDGYDGRKIRLPADVVARANANNEVGFWVLREAISGMLKNWVEQSKHLRDEHEKLLRGTSL